MAAPASLSSPAPKALGAAHKASQRRQPSLSTSTRKPSGMRGTPPSPSSVQAGQGAPAPPQVQAREPSTGGPGGSRKPAEIVTVGARRGASAGQRFFIAGNQATQRKGSASCMSKRLAALAATKSCNADEISASVSAARRANASAASEVASRDHPSTGLKETIRTAKAYWPDRRFCRIVSRCQLHPFRARRNRRARRSLQAPDRCRGRVGQLTQSRARLRYTGRRERPGCRGQGGRPGPLRRLGNRAATTQIFACPCRSLESAVPEE